MEGSKFLGQEILLQPLSASTTSAILINFYFNYFMDADDIFYLLKTLTLIINKYELFSLLKSVYRNALF